jgi:hypothetical protein
VNQDVVGALQMNRFSLQPLPEMQLALWE